MRGRWGGMPSPNRSAKPLERLRVQQVEPSVLDAVQAALLQPRQRAVGVHERQAERVGDVLLCQRERHAAGATVGKHHRRTLEQQDQQRRDAFERAAPAHREQVVVDQRLLVRGQPGDVEAEPRRLAVQLPQRIAAELAQQRRRERFDAVGADLAHLLLNADEVARQQEVQDLAPAVAQGLVPERPAREEGVQRRVALAFGDHRFAGPEPCQALLETLDEGDLRIGVRREERVRAQRTVLAGDVVVHGCSDRVGNIK